MPRQAISQASCTECGEDEDNLTVTDTSMGHNCKDEPFVGYEARCECGEHSYVVLGNSGISHVHGLDHSDASWNTEDEDDE